MSNIEAIKRELVFLIERTDELYYEVDNVMYTTPHDVQFIEKMSDKIMLNLKNINDTAAIREDEFAEFAEEIRRDIEEAAIDKFEMEKEEHFPHLMAANSDV